MKTKLLKYYTLIIFLSFSSQQIIENITLDNESIIIEDLIESKYFKIGFNNITNLPNYLKIIAQDNKATNSDYANYVISYYQNDSDFINRKHLSYSPFNSTIMWLNKEQIKDNFFLSVECSEFPCNYSLIISLKNYTELLFGEQYSYLITKENKDMNILIKGNEFPNISLINSTLSIWIKSKDKIETNLMGANYSKLSNFNSYIMRLEKEVDPILTLKIKGNEGDYISIGSLFCEGNNKSLCYINDIYDGIEYSGILKRNISEKNCFSRQYIKTEFYQFIYPNNNTQIKNASSSSSIDYFCIDLPENYDEIFYSIIGYDYESPKKVNKLYPIINGINYQKKVNLNQTVGFISFRPNDLYYLKYLSFNIYSSGIDTEAYIANCNNYPLCDLNYTYIKDKIKLQRFYSTYSFTYIGKELDKNWTPINKSQKILIFKCNKGISEEIDYCEININIFTDKTYIQLKQMYIQHSLFIREETEHNLFLENQGIITIEKISGEINIDTGDNFNFFYGNQKNIYVYGTNNNDNWLNLKIKAKKRSVYTIKYHYLYIDNFQQIYSYYFGGNYLFNFPTEEIILKYDDDMIKEDDKWSPSYFSLYPINCKIELEYIYYNSTSDNISYIPIKFENDFYQDIYMEEDKKDGAIFVKAKRDKESCQIFVSTFKLQNKTNELFNLGIFLLENSPQSFIFTKKYSEIKFVYFHPNINEDIFLTFNLQNNSKYLMSLFINDIEYEKSFNLTKSQIIKIEVNFWKNICKEIQQMCEISFIIFSENTENDSLLQIIINNSNNDNKDNNGDNNDEKDSNLDTILIVVFSIVGVILLLIIIFIIIKCKNGDLNMIDKVKDLKNSLV